jgi:hypothetical protein
VRMKKVFTFLIDSGPIVVLAAIAFCGSFAHIRQTAIDHGQTGWMATAVAICVDLVGFVAAKERQRDKKAGRGLGWPTTVLVGDVVLSLAANLDQAQSSVWGWITAGAPCAAFMVAVSLAERRGAHRVARGVGEVREAPAFETAPEPPQEVAERPDVPPAFIRKVGAAVPPTEAEDILPRAREVAEAYFAQHRKHISRDKLKVALGISTARATALRRELKATGI